MASKPRTTLDKPQPTSNETQTISVKSRPALGKSRNRKPIKQYFLIGSIIGLVTGISFIFLGTKIADRIENAPYITKENLQKDLEIDFLKTLKYHFDPNVDIDAIGVDPDVDPDAIGVNSDIDINVIDLLKYQQIISNDSDDLLLKYLARNEYVLESDLYFLTPYDDKEFVKQATQVLKNYPEIREKLKESVCKDIKYLIDKECDKHFGSNQDFNKSLLDDLNPTTKDDVNTKISGEIDRLQKEFSYDMEKDISKRYERAEFFHNLVNTGIILIMVSTTFFLPTITVYLIDRNKKKEEKIFERHEKVEKAKDSFAKTPWQSASTVLGDYYDRNLQQITKIYNTSLLAIWFGFGLIVASIGLGIGLAGTEELPEQQQDLLRIMEEQNTEIKDLSKDQLEILLERPEGNSRTVITLIGVGAGIISNFVGATFLFLYQATLKQASEYTQGLSKTNTVGISMAILAELTKEQQEKQKEQALLEGYSPQDTEDKIANTKLEISKLVIAQLQSLKENSEKNGHVNTKA